MNVVLVLVSVFLLYLIVFGGQYSLFSLLQAKHINQNAKDRNMNQLAENSELASENYRIQTDKELQIELSKELGYMEEGEQIIKRTD